MYPIHYIEYLAHFHATRDYFECHEILEEYWKQTDPRNKKSVWVCLIQIAVLMYHYRNQNERGALKMIVKAEEKIPGIKCELAEIGLSSKALHDLLLETRERILLGLPYKPTTLPIMDVELYEAVKDLCVQRGYSLD